MSRHPNGADETSSASGGPLNNPLTDNEENEKKRESLGPLQQSDAASPAEQESSPDNPAADPHIATTSASGALDDDDADNNNPAAGALSSTAQTGSSSAKRQRPSQYDSDDTALGGENKGGALPQQLNQISSPLNSTGSGDDKDSTISSANAAITSASSISPKGSGNIEDDDGTDQEVPVSSNNDNSNVTWKPQEMQSVCEFTHTIADYSQKRDSGCKKAEYSDITVDDRGNKWRLIVYVNGNGRASNHHLSLFLQVADADDLPFGWKKAVSYVLTLEHPRGSNISYAKRNPDKTFKLCPKAIDWGWSQFITSDRIQQEGFVQNDSLIVRASVTVKSSSVTIDAEDAELYLKCAVEEGKPDAVQLCLDQGASVNCQFKDDLYTPLHTACSASPTDPDNSDGDSTKSAAASVEGSMKVLKLLLEKGADGNACNKWKETPLLIAANNGHKAAVEALLKHGADPSLCSEAGWSALTFAAHKGYDDIVALLLNAGAPVNCRVTEDSSTPLHKACAGSKTGHLNAVKLLLGGRADVHALNKWRETPLLTAANHGQAGAVEALLKAGADPCKCTDTGWSPLSIAAYKGHDDVVKLLLEEGAPTEEADPTLSALLQAATKGLPDTVKLLLKHGADHTVTTKKGDTALSILVEANLIDAAVEMVMKYKASIPRCSRDRKKVQRARLLINLRLKQLQRDGVSLDSDDDDSETDDVPEMEDESPAVGALTDGISDPHESTTGKQKSKKKNKSVSPEEQAKAAEEALLMELEQEDAERNKQEKEANKKSAKKRKKKERERQQKKEQEEQRMAEEKAKEEERMKEQKAREASERAERERQTAARKKEEQEMRRKQEEAIRKQQKEEERRKKLEKEKEAEERKKALQKQKQLEKTKNGQQTKTKGPWNTGSAAAASQPSQAGKTAAKAQATTPAKSAAGAKKRGWESLPNATSANNTSPSNGKSSPSAQPGKTGPSSASKPNIPAASNAAVTPVGKTARASESTQAVSPKSASPAAVSVNNVSSPSQNADWSMEPPAVAVFRREKISELLHRCSIAHMSNDPLGFVEESVLRKVLYRWIIRAAHDSSEFIDFMIPSWVDLEKLSTFFQRQFISESRRGSGGRSMMGMESLKEAGTTMATLCQTLARSVAVFRQQVEQQVSSNWNDAGVGMAASEVIRNLGNPGVVIDWAKRSQIHIPSLVFVKLKEMHTLPQSRLLSSIFVSKVSYDTIAMMTGESMLDFRLLPATKSKLSLHLSVSAEIWSDPFTSLSGNKFFGQYDELDKAFSGSKPFGNVDGSDQFLVDQGGSALVVAPPDNMLATRYIRRIVDIVQSKPNVPRSFAIFLRADCLVGTTDPPSIKDLYSLDSRLSDDAGMLSLVEPLVGGGHVYFNEQQGGSKPSTTGSLFVLVQNAKGRTRYPLSNAGLNEVLDSMKTEASRQSDRSLGPAISYSGSAEMTGVNDLMFMPQNAYSEPPSAIPASPMAHQPIVSTDFGTIGQSAPPLPNSFAPTSSPGGQRRPGPRRGRLFDLVDDDGGEEDNMNDVVSGMLGTLNVDLFQNSGVQDVDIEAISLMGIGGSAGPSNNLQPRSSSRHHFG
ncbi:MAG: hypothetical protein SGILL_002904 [Bacillariaceae sp.]